MGVKDFLFKEPLKEGILVERRNRFIVDVKINGEIHTCHCPSTGKIGNFDLRGRPCLLSKSDNPNRKTTYTVEALSFNKVEDSYKSWIGINQNAINRYVEYYLSHGAFEDMVGELSTVMREQTLGNAKIDFRVGDVFIEVKMPLWRIDMEVPDYISTHDNGIFNSHERLLKHLNAFSSFLKGNQKAILLFCYMYDHSGVRINRKNPRYRKIKRMLERGTIGGMEQWQANFKITERGVRLTRYFQILE
ncbi:sugar fermentation stimulation protein [Mycoplasma haemocanis str. Illinois]|uniref:Sugar fermentation stimulation protein n=1 Tax=Mycoplasma haemocanis (strain Illinois) TaxID=1111676 RepID=H6N6R4_MYCHN|nr:DNA/RNA nuclease SfsA [Mycoplasma haemocanis]AEW45336.1 sugar fermentation stimulation protein [Mycoplasma haemocanis str. Illinois]